MSAAMLMGSQKSSLHAAGYFTTGATEWTRQTLPLYGPRELILRKQINKLKRLLANKTLEVDFFKRALQRVGARLRQSSRSGAKACMTK